MRTRFVVAFVFLLSLMASATVTITGNVKDLTSTNVTTKTTVMLELKNGGGNICRVSGAIIGPQFKAATPDSSGNFSFTNVYTNAEITCGGTTGNTFYKVTVLYQGQPVGSQNYQFSAGAALSALTPLSSNPTSDPATINVNEIQFGNAPATKMTKAASGGVTLTAYGSAGIAISGGSGTLGPVSVTGGSGGTNQDGVGVTITGGAAGSGARDSTGGSVNIYAGAGNAGTNGMINIGSAGSTMLINLGQDTRPTSNNTYNLGWSSARFATGYFNVVDAGTGFTINGSAAVGAYPRGNGTNFVSSTIQAGDLPALSTTWSAIVVPMQLNAAYSATGGVLGGGANATNFSRFTPPFNITINRIDFEVTTAQAGKFAGCAIYNNLGTTQLATSGAISVATTGLKSATISDLTLNGATQYVLACTTDSTTAQFTHPLEVGLGPLSFTNLQWGAAGNAGSAGVPPSTVGSFTGTIGRYVPIVQLWKF